MNWKWVRRPARRLWRTISTEQQRHLKQTLRRGSQKLPAGVERRVKNVLAIGRPAANARRGRDVVVPVDPLGLAQDPGQEHSVAMAGRAAAAGTDDARRAERLVAALRTAGSDSPTARRRVAGVMGPDLAAALRGAEYDVVPLAPGTAAAVAGESSVEVLLIDLAGFSGLWAGGLGAQGAGLFAELHEAIARAHSRGATIWVLDRGADRFAPGGCALRQDARIHVIAGPPAAEHPTEDPGDAPRGLVDIARQVGGMSG